MQAPQNQGLPLRREVIIVRLKKVGQINKKDQELFLLEIQSPL